MVTVSTGLSAVERVEIAYTCTATEAVGDIVCLDPSGSNKVIKASNTSTSTAPAIGIIVSKPSTTTAVIRTGVESGGFVGIVAGATYFLGTSGTLTTTAPTATGTIVQSVGIGVSSTKVLIDPEINYFVN